MSALRLARGFTGRSKVVKFAGCYHGHVDALLASAGSGLATFALPDSAGVPASSAGETIVLPYNDVAALEAAFAEHGDADRRRHHRGGRRATWASSRRQPGFTEALRRVTRAHGALLISDEVMTGFRCSAVGLVRPRGAVRRGRRPTSSPSARSWAAASRPRRSAAAPTSWRMLAPLGPVYQAGTLSGNPVATAAGLATLRGCTPEVYDRLDVGQHGHRRRGVATRWAPPACRTSSSGPAACSRVFFRDGDGRATTTTRKPRTRGVHGRSSTRC